MTVQASNVQRETTDRRAAIMRMDRAQLGGAWYVHLHRNSDDRVARPAIALRARELGMTQRDLAAEAHKGGLLSDEQMAGYR